MARDLTSGFIAEIEAKSLAVALLVTLYFDSATSYVWTGVGPLEYGGNTYLGVGSFGTVDKIEESQFVKAVGTTLQLSGIPANLLSVALSENYQGRRAEIFFAVLDTTTGAVIADPFRIFAGNMDVMEIQDTGETGTITVTVENELIDLFKPRLRYYTPEDQKTEFPDDKGLDFIAKLQDYEVVWKDKES